MAVYEDVKEQLLIEAISLLNEGLVNPDTNEQFHDMLFQLVQNSKLVEKVCKDKRMVCFNPKPKDFVSLSISSYMRVLAHLKPETVLAYFSQHLEEVGIEFPSFA